MTRRTILVVGATGKQGSATVAQLCALPQSKAYLRVIALTRNKASDAAFELKRKYPQIEIHQGDLDNVGSLFDSLPGTPDAMFSVQATMGKGYTPLKEVQQGQKLHEAAIDVGVKHIVYTSVDRHGNDSDTTVTKVPHFDSKFEIEQHLSAECARSTFKTTWTILRPTTFFDNLTPDFVGQVVAATIGRCPRPQQMVAVRDIGWFAARALTGFRDSMPNESWVDESLENPYIFRKISLAGDEIDLPAMRSRFYEKMGYPLPEAYSFLGGAALWSKADLGIMYKWLEKVGYNADIAECRREHPGMLNFAQWLQTESKFTMANAVMGGWLK